MPSSVIRYIDYNEGENALTVTFQTGAVYVYYNVPPSVHVGLVTARSKGRYFNRVIASQFSRSEEGRGGKECVSTGRSRWVREHSKKYNVDASHPVRHH